MFTKSFIMLLLLYFINFIIFYNDITLASSNKLDNDTTEKIVLSLNSTINGLNIAFIAKEDSHIEYDLHLFCMEHNCSKQEFGYILNAIREYIYDNSIIDNFDIGISKRDNNDHSNLILSNEKYNVMITNPIFLEFFIEKYNCLDMRMIGNESLGGAYNVCYDTITDSLNVLYSFGIFNDASFDVDMANLGFLVHSFDPSKISIEYMEILSYPINMIFYPVGLSNLDEDSVINTLENNMEKNEFPLMRLYRLSSIMNDLQHTYLAMLKIDIEGFELRVLQDLTNEEIWNNNNSPLINVGQLCIEFHWAPEYCDIPVHKSAAIIEQSFKVLHKYGFREYYRNKRKMGSVQTSCMININRIKL